MNKKFMFAFFGLFIFVLYCASAIEQNCKDIQNLRIELRQTKQDLNDLKPALTYPAKISKQLDAAKEGRINDKSNPE